MGTHESFCVATCGCCRPGRGRFAGELSTQQPPGCRQVRLWTRRRTTIGFARRLSPHCRPPAACHGFYSTASPRAFRQRTRL